MPRIEPPATATSLAACAVLLGTLALASCGMEAAGTAASVAATQAAQASQAQAQAARIVDGFKQAQEAGMARAASAAE